MKILTTFLFFIFLCNFAFAEKIKEIEIERVTIGDSLLDFYSRSEIKKNCVKENFKNNKYYLYNCLPKNFQKYDLLQFALKTNDEKFTVYNVQGIKKYSSIEACNKTQNNILKNFNTIFINSEKFEETVYHPMYMGTGSKAHIKGYTLDDNTGVVDVSCYDWRGFARKLIKMNAQLRVSLSEMIFYRWLINEAYK